MTKKFSLKQLFSIIDGRMSTNIGDIYDILNHVCDADLMTHQLPIAKDYLLSKKPLWFLGAKTEINVLYSKCPIKERNMDQFRWCMENIRNIDFDVTQLKDEFDTSDFSEYMGDNSLLLNR